MRYATPLRRKSAALFLATLLPLAAGAAPQNPDAAVAAENKITLQPWSVSLYAQIEKEYGPEAVKRMRYIYDLIRVNRDKPVREKLETVNTALNLFPWLTDKQQWNLEDYWATPLETLAQFGGDCEDMAIGKFVMLRLMGVPKKNLYLGYAKIKESGQAHMVLVWSNDDRSESLVLDNFDKELKPGRERNDLQAIYLFDADGNVILLNDTNGQRSVKAEIGKRKMEKLQTLKQRILENNRKYMPYNEGRPLWVH